MTVYVVGCEGSRLVKIGSTAGDPARRLAELQTGSPYPLRLLWLSTPEHGIEAEVKLHKLFEGYRTHGEWFDFGDADPAVLATATIALPAMSSDRLGVRRRGASSPGRPDTKKSAEKSAPSRSLYPSQGLLADINDVAGKEPIPASKLATLLTEKYPAAYERMTGKSLVSELKLLGVKVPSTGNRFPISPSVVRDASRDRSD